MRRIVILSFAALAATAILLVALAAILPPPALPRYSTIVTDRQDRFVHAFLAPDGAWRMRTSPSALPQRFRELLLHKEDRWFRIHPGFNPLAMARAAVQNLRSGRRISGASTITMQVARLLEPKERTYANKFLEVFRAVQLELRYSKEEILELYLSLVPLGGNIEGLSAGALLYFQTPLERLNIARQADLILIPNDPNRLRPDLHPDALLARRIALADHWERLELLSTEEAEIMRSTPAEARRTPLPRLAPHFAARVKEQAATAEIRSTLDLDIQRRTEDRLGRHVRAWRSLGVRNGAVMVVENFTGNVVAYAGTADFADSLAGGQIDAVRAVRSPGSTLKPFLYALAFDQGTLSPKKVLLDVPYDADGYTAENYDGTFAGSVRADEALRRSLNTPMIRLLSESGTDRMLDLLGKAGLHTMRRQSDQLGLSFIVGGCGTTLEELTSGYSALANRGAARPLRFALADSAHASIHNVCSPSAAYLVSKILSENEETRLDPSDPRIALKTGTSYGRRDAWCLGFTRKYTIGVWVGNLDNVGSPELVGSRAAMPLLLELFRTIDPRSSGDPVPRPDDIDVRTVCAKSGMLAGPLCTETLEEEYSFSHTLQRTCDVEQEFSLSVNRNTQYCPSCLGTHPHRRTTMDVYPAELLAFWRSTGKIVAQPPPHDADCTRTFAQSPPTILSPSDRMTYWLTHPTQQIGLRAAPATSVRKHHWYIDKEFIATQPAGREMLVALSAGRHTITCLDDNGQRSTVTIDIKHVL